MVLLLLLGISAQAAGSAPRLQEALRDPRYKVRIQAAAALARSDEPGARAALEGLLGDPDGLVRAAACDALMALGDPAAVPRIEPLLQDPADTVRRRARLAIRVLGSRPPRPAEPAAPPPSSEAVLLGSVVDNSGAGYSNLVASLREGLEQELKSQSTALLALTRRYELLAQVREVVEHPDTEQSRVDVRCHLTVAELPGRTLRLSTQVTASAAVSGLAAPGELNDLARDAAAGSGAALIREFASWAVVQPAPAR